MRAWSVLLVLALLATVLAGCVDDAEPGTEAVAPEPSPTSTVDPLVDYAVNATDNESMLEGAHTHDDWGSATELALLDAAVSTAECANPFTSVFLLGFGLFSAQEAHYGCATFTLSDGVIVPEGTARLRVEIDAASALLAGGMQLAYSNEFVRFEALDATTETTHLWSIGMNATEWDLPHNDQTTWSWFLFPSGNPAVLNGEIHVRVFAEKVEGWEPILASAHIDHWGMEGHDFVSDGVLRALDTNVTVTFPSFADRITGAQGFENVPLTDIVPPGTTQLTLTAVWSTVANCPPAHGCWVVPFLSSSTGGRIRIGNEVERTDTYGIYLFEMGDDLGTDSPYATESIFSVGAFVRECPNGEPQQTPLPFFNGCMGEAVASTSADTRLEVEAWKNGADVSALKARLGLA